MGSSNIMYKRRIQAMLVTMEEGQRVEIDEDMFAGAYQFSALSMYDTHEQVFLSSIIGSAWGKWRVYHDTFNHVMIISKHKTDDRRYYEDPDRRHLFKQMPDGTLQMRKDAI